MGSIELDSSNPIVIIRINNEAKLNAWDSEMRDTLTRELQHLATDPGCKAVMVTGGGDRAFCAGADITELRHLDAVAVETSMAGYQSLFDAVRLFPKPIIAAVVGVAAGSGFQFALMCDAVVTHSDARLGQPELKSGLGTITGSWMIAQAVGLMRMKDLALSGRLISGTEAARWGIASNLVRREDVVDRGIEMAEELSALPPIPFAISKRAIAEFYEDGYQAAFSLAQKLHPQIPMPEATVGGRKAT